MNAREDTGLPYNVYEKRQSGDRRKNIRKKKKNAHGCLSTKERRKEERLVKLSLALSSSG